MFSLLSWLIGRKATRPTCPHCRLIEQARELVDNGYYVGAVATACCELQAKLKALTLAISDERPASWHSHAVAIHLHEQGLLTLNEARRASAAVAIAVTLSRSAARCDAIKAHRMVREIEAVLAMLERALPRFAKAMAIAA